MSFVPLCALLVALPWLWPFTSGPVAATLPYLAGVTVAAVLLLAWPARAPGRDAPLRAVAAGWLAAALASSGIALLQYFDLETPLFPWVNIAEPGQAFGNLRQPNQLASLLVIGLWALRWLLLRGGIGRGVAIWMAALMSTALAATASRVGLVEFLALGALALWWAARAGGRWRVAALAVLGALALYALAAVALPWALQASEGAAGRDLVERLRSAESTCGSRFILYSNVLHLISLKPWTGWGWFVQPNVVMVICIYLILNIAYSFWLKHQPVLDIFAIAFGFVLRVYAGAQALAVPVSSWMFVTTLCLALYLAAIKRRQELRQSGSEGREVLLRYSVALVDRYAEMAATGALVFYSMFVMSAQPALVVTVPVVLFGLFRYWYVVEKLDGGESPTDALLSDMPLLATVAIWVSACLWVLWPTAAGA